MTETYRVGQPPTRFEGGVNDQASGAPLRELPFPNPFTCSVLADDFHRYAAGDWTITDVGTSAQALQNLDGGVLRLTTGATSGNNCFLQNTAESMLIEAGKPAWFAGRVNLDDATLAAMIAGMYITTAAPLGTQPTDGIYFLKAAADTELKLVVRKDGTSTELVVGDLADNTFAELVWFYDGASKVMAFVNNQHVGSVVVTNLPDDEELAQGFGVQTSSAAARIMDVDFVMQAKRR